MSAKPNQPAIPDISKLVGGLMQQAAKGQANKQNEWWQTYHYPETPSFHVSKLIACARSALYSQAIKEGSVYETEKELSGRLDKENLEELVKAFNGRLIYDLNRPEDYNVLFYVFSDGAVQVIYDGYIVFLNMVTLDKKKSKLFKKHVQSCVSDEQVETDSD